MDISVIIATNSEDYLGLNRVIDSFVIANPLSTEIVIATPLDIPIDLPQVRYAKEGEPKGSCAAYNLAAANTTGKYILATTDDWIMQPGWWEVFSQLGDAPYGSLFTGSMCGVKVAYAPIVRRDLYEGIMQKHFFNPMYFHQYMDNDLALRLHQNGINLREFSRVPIQFNMQHDNAKMGSKDKYFRLDGMLFRRTWGHLPGLLDLCPLFSHSTLGTDEELTKIAEERWLLNPYN